MSSNKANKKPGNTRRWFLQAGAAALAEFGMVGAASSRPRETLALSGGPKAAALSAKTALRGATSAPVNRAVPGGALAIAGGWIA